MPKQKIRFAVGGPDVRRSAVWSLFWRERDAYVVSVEAAGIAKFSFHLAIDEISWGYTRDYFETNRQSLNVRSRDFERRPRPPEYKPGLTLLLRLYVANEALALDPDLPTKKHIHWVEPRLGKAVGFNFLIAAEGVAENPFEKNPDHELLARATFPFRRESMLLYAHQIEASIISESANRASIALARDFPGLPLPTGHRVYTQVVPPELFAGSLSLVEISTYVLPFGPQSNL